MLRRFRAPLAARVTLEHGRPARVTVARPGLSGGRIVAAAGPWRASGDWWDARTWWTRDEWDVALADATVYHLHRDRDTDRWFVDALVD